MKDHYPKPTRCHEIPPILTHPISPKEKGSLQHACLAFMVIGDDGLDHRELLRDEHTQTRESESFHRS
jgi:hypothetical protein